MTHLRKLLLHTAALFALTAPAATAAPESKSATSGQVSASVEWDRTDSRGVRNVRVSITRAGAGLVRDERVQSRCRRFCHIPSGDTPIRIRDINGDAEPEVLLDLYTGGAHCCSNLLIYEYDPTDNAYVRVRRGFGNAGYVLRDVGRNGTLEFVTGDDRFSYLYTSYLESARPLMIYRYNLAGQMVDVTRKARAEIRRHRKGLARFIKALRREDGLDLRGAYAAWQADNYLLGRRAAARGWTALRKAAARGDLRKRTTNGGPSGKRFLRKLRKDLKKFGYIR